jgi:hypothetical protein
MRDILSSIERSFHQYKDLGEGAMRQLQDSELSREGEEFSNSTAILVWHISGNLKSRFTDFLTTDGEKPWRARDSEFVARTVTRGDLLKKWEEGWSVLFATLSSLTDEDLRRTVVIRGQSLAVHDALHRALAHVSYHVGQIVYIAKSARGAAWKFMTIRPGKSEEYNRGKKA